MSDFQAVFKGEFKNLEDVIEHFSPSPEELRNVEMIFACYDHEDYEGWAMVLFIKDGKFFEFHASHCSCNGLEWGDPEETIPSAILMRENISQGCREALMKRFERVLAFE